MAQDNLNAYAQWLVQNKDKKGTPEFDKVARAFQMLQAAGPRQSEAPVNPPGTGVGRAFQRGVIGTKQGIQAGIATNAANTLESMDVDRLTTIKRALGIVVPKDALAMMEADGTLQALGSVRNEEELNRWFDSLDRDFDLGPQNVAKLKAMVGGAEAAKSDYRAPGGKFETVRETGQEALTRASELEADRAALPMSPVAQRGAQDFQDAEGVIDWARKSFKDPMAALAFIGETAAETGPAMAAGIGTSVVTGNPLLGAGIMIAASTPREYGGEVMSFLREQDIDVSDPQAIRAAIDNGNIMAEAQKRGLTKSAIISAFEAIGMKGGGNILLQGGKQAFTGGAGEATSQVALDGEITSAKEVALEAVAELATTPGEAAILYTKNGTLKDPSSLSDTESQAAASLAQRIRTIANQNGYNLKDVGNTGDAKQALEAAHEQISGQIKEIVANPAVKKYLNPKQAKTLDQLIDDYAAAQVAIRQGKNKVKSKVTQENFDAIMRLLPPTVEAQQIANLMREGNQLTDLFKNGTKGGISQFTDTFNPFTREDGSYDPSKVISGMANKGVAIATMGGSLPYQFSAVGAGRAIDAVTGRRSAVNRFVRKYEGKDSLPDPVGPSLIAAERLKKEQDDARAAELGGLPQVDKDNSPIGTILSGTGLDRDGLKAAMTEIKAAFPDVKALDDVFGDIRKNLDGGTNKIRNLNDIIPVINQHLNTPDTTVQRAAAPDQLLAQRGGVNIPNIDQTPAQNTPTPDVMSQAPRFGPQFTTQENYNRGIEANKAMNAELVEGVTTDPELNRVQKGRLITSLDVLANNLGSDPVAAAQEQVQKLEEAGVPQEAIEAYIQPYVDRVARQQSRPRENTSILNEMMADNPKKPQAPRLAPEQIPTQTRKVYKLMKVQKSRPGEILPLFAKSGGDKGPASGYTFGEWFGAENQRPKLGNKLLAPRPGIHAVNLPVFDQGKAKVKGEQRVWVEVEIPAVSPETQAESDNSPVLSNGMRTGVQDRLISPNESYDYKTNPNASNDAGGWPVAGSMKALRIVPDAEIAQILRDNGLDHQVENSFSDVDEAKAQQLMRQATPIEDAMAPREQSALNMFKDPLSIDGKPTVKKIGEAMTQDHMDTVGRQLFPETSEDDYQTVFNYAAEEMLEQLKQPNSGVGWYSADVEEAMRLASKVYPTLATDPTHRQLYLTFAGIFSNGSDPDNAFMMSSWAFEDFLRTGQIPVNRAEGFYQQGLEPPKTTFKSTKTGKMVTKDAGWGIRNQANEQQLGMLRYLVETRGGLQSAMDFLLTPQSREDINNVMLDSGLYKAGRYTTKKDKAGPDEYGFLAFGKKLGRYSLGLHGVDIDAGDTTIDLWYTRTFRRWTGRLLETPIGKEGVAAQPANDAERDIIFRLTGELADKFGLPPGDVQAVLWFFEKRTWGSQGLNTKEGTNSSGARKLLREKGIDPDDGAGSDAETSQPSPEAEQPRGSIGVAGALANAIQGSNPRSSAGDTLPSDAEVKQQYAPTRAAFQVGKKGTDTENGIKDVEGVNRLAEAMGINLKAYGAQRRMSKEMNPGGRMSVGLTGLFLPRTNTAAYLKPGVKRADGSIVGENESFITALHELAHGIAEKNADGSVSPHSTRMTNNLTDSSDVVRVGSFEYLIGEILERPLKERNEIRDEIIKLQDKTRFNFADGTSQSTRDLVEVEQMYEQMSAGRDESFRRKWAPIIRNHMKYVRNVYEMAVDPLIWYLFDPKAFKKEAPKTAKLIRDYFNEAGKIQFYSHPLAMGVAVVLAMLMKADQEDEQKNQMPPGALNQPMPMGALSQA